jgi:hypothetical protein
MSGRLVGIIVPGVDNAAEKGQLYKQSHQIKFISSGVGEKS